MRKRLPARLNSSSCSDLAAPRGFCAGVDRAIKIVEMALEKWGAPVFVRHEIVHNKFVVDDLRSWARSSSKSWTNARPTGR
jgi:4-hydroxy-3-methylbut-2-enyl diphosphate reductase IspH